MRIEQIAAQLFTLREHLKTPADIRASLERVAGIGFRAVQVSGMGPIAEEELKDICDDQGLSICSTHEKGDRLLEKTDAVIERLGKLGCTHTAYPSPHLPIDTEEQVLALADKLNVAGERLRDAGITLSYHNHARELRRFGNRTVLDLIYERADPDCLEAELDLYWVQAGGASPQRWVEKLAGRQRAVHLKDGATPPGENILAFCEVGNGNLDWEHLIPALEAGGTEWYIIEQDRCPADPFDSLASSFGYLKDTFVAA